MYSTLFSVALFTTLAIRGALADLHVDTPKVVACQDVKLTWASDNSKSYDVAIVPVSDPCNTVLADLGEHTMNHITWKNVTLEPGTQVMVSVLSDTDDGWSGHVTVEAGDDKSCLASSSTSSSASSSAASSSASQKTTLVVANAAGGPSTSPTSAPAAPTGGAAAVGAAAAGVVGNGAMSVGFSMTAVVLSAVAGIAALV